MSFASQVFLVYCGVNALCIVFVGDEWAGMYTLGVDELICVYACARTCVRTRV